MKEYELWIIIIWFAIVFGGGSIFLVDAISCWAADCPEKSLINRIEKAIIRTIEKMRNYFKKIMKK